MHDIFIILAFLIGFYFGNRTVAKEDFQKIKRVLKIRNNSEKIIVFRKKELLPPVQENLKKLDKKINL